MEIEINKYEKQILQRWIDDEVFMSVPNVTWWSDVTGHFVVSYPGLNDDPLTFEQIQATVSKLPKWLARCSDEHSFFQSVGAIKKEIGEMFIRESWSAFIREAKKKLNHQNWH